MSTPPPPPSDVDASHKKGRHGPRALSGLDTSAIIEGSSTRGVKRMRSESVSGNEGGGKGGKEGEVVEVGDVGERRARARRVGEELMRVIMEEKDADGRQLYQVFYKLPSKRQFADYYAIIKSPQSLETIQHRLSLTLPPTLTPAPAPAASSSVPPTTAEEPASSRSTGRAAAVSAAQAIKSDAGGKKDKDGEGEIGGEEGYEGYEGVEGVKRDFATVFNNAKRYNQKESLIFDDARKLHKLMKDTFSRLTSLPASTSGDISGDISMDSHPAAAAADEDDEMDGSSSQKRARVSGSEATGTDGEGGSLRIKRGPYMQHGPSVYKLLKAAMKEMGGLKSRDAAGTRRICEMFEVLPSRADYPDYYQVIKQPISLTEITQKLQSRQYEEIMQWKKDVDLMCSNAMTYNVEGSDVYRDALFLQAEVSGSILQDMKDRIAGKTPVVKQRIRDNRAGSGSDFGGTPFSGRMDTGNASSSYRPAVNPGAGPSFASPGPGTTQRQSAQFVHSTPATMAQSTGPPLPENTVTQEIVDNLDKYTSDDQIRWASSLDGANCELLSKMMYAKSLGKKLTEIAEASGMSGNGSTEAAIATTQSAVVLPPRGPPNVIPPPSAPQGFALPKRRPPPMLPLVRYLYFTHDIQEPSPNDLKIRKKTIRLRNLRGVVSHTVNVRSRTTLAEVSAVLEEGFYDLMPPVPYQKEVRNGDQVETRISYEKPKIATTLAHSPLPELTLRVNNAIIPATLTYPDGDLKKRPNGAKWEVPLPVDMANVVIEITVSRAAEMEMVPEPRRPALLEVCRIFVGRQA